MKSNRAENSEENVIRLADKMRKQAEEERSEICGVGKEKLPLTRDKRPPKPYPVKALRGLAPVVEALSRVVQVPATLAAQCTLPAVNYALQAHADVDAGFGRRPISCYYLTSARSGERKSATDRQAWSAVESWQDVLIARGGAAALAPAGAEGAPKISPVILVSEPTSEGLIQHLERSIGSCSLSTDEAGAFIGGFAMSRDQSLKTMAKLSTCWDGRAITSMRAGSTKSRVAAGKRLNVNLLAQPEVIAQLLASPMARQQGFLSRCLLAEPPSRIGTRKFASPDPSDVKVITEYTRKLYAILRKPLPVVEGSGNRLAPRVLNLSGQAVELLAEFADSVEAECGEGGRLASIADFGSKCPEHAIRIGATLVLWENFDAKRIHSKVMADAITLVEWYTDEALRLSGAEIDADLDLAIILLDWLQGRKNLSEPFSLVEVYQRGPSRIRNAKTARRILKVLGEHGWCESISETVDFDGLPRQEAYRLI